MRARRISQTDFHLEARYTDEKFSFFKRCTREFTEEHLRGDWRTEKGLRQDQVSLRNKTPNCS